MAVLLAACTSPNPEFVDKDRAAPPDASQPTDAAMPGDVAPADRAPPPPDQAPDRPVDQSPPVDPNLPDLRTGLVAYWQLNEAAAALIAKDRLGQGHDGMLEGLDVANVWGRPGKFETAIEFPQVGRAPGIQVPATAAINALHHYTLGAWIYRTAPSSNRYDFIISRQQADSDAEVLSLLVLRDRLRAYAPYPIGGPAAAIDASGTIPQQRWVHVAVTYDGATLALYQDGQPAGSMKYATSALPATSKPLYIGANKNADPNEGQPFVGYLDEVMVYARALTPAQVKALGEGARPRL